MGSVAQVWFWRFPKVPPAAFDGRLRFQGGLRQAAQRRVHSFRKSGWMTALRGAVSRRSRAWDTNPRPALPALNPAPSTAGPGRVRLGTRRSNVCSPAPISSFCGAICAPCPDRRRRPWRGVPAGNPSPVFLVDPARRPRSPIRTSAISSEAEWHESRRPSRVDPTGPSGVGYTIASFAKVRE